MLRVHGFVHEEGAAQVAAAVVRDALVETGDLFPVFFFSGGAEDGADIRLGGGGDTDEEGAGADRRDDAGGGVGEEDQPDVVGVFFHGTAKGGLSVACQGVGFVDHDDFEALFGVEVDLLGLRDFFQEFLDHDSVIVADVGRGDLEVIDGGDDVEFEFTVTRRLKDPSINFDLFYPWSVEGSEGCEDTGLLASAGGAVEEEMWEVSR